MKINLYYFVLDLFNISTFIWRQEFDGRYRLHFERIYHEGCPVAI